MAKGGRDPNLVWSSDDGDMRKAGRRGPGSGGAPGVSGVPGAAGAAGAAGGAGGRVKVRRETAGRRGKAVTTVTGLPLDDDGIRALAGRLKKRCGVGGSAKDGVIELQGDHRSVVVEELRAAGYDVVLAGG
jgi:translation initiation factor 1